MNTFKITALLCHIKLTPRELEECKVALVSLHSNNANQHKFFEYCFEYKMAPWIYLQLQKHDFLQLFDDDIKELFKNTHEDVKKENENRNKVAKQFLQAFHENNIDVIILKGNSFIHTIYKNTGYKKMNDFDILIKFEDWPKIEQIYYDFGYIPLGFGWSGEKQKPAKYSHTSLPFISKDFKCLIGTQWGLKSPTTHFTLDSKEIWDTTIVLDFYGIPCKQLSPEYNLLHLILHLGVYKCGIRDCMDLFNLIQTTNINKEKLFAIIEKSKAKEKSFYALKMCNLCSPYIPSGWIEHLEVDSSSFIITRLKKRFEMFKETKDFHGSYNDYFQDIEKNVIHLYLFPHFHKRFKYLLKVIRLLYFPDMKDALKFIDKSHKPKLFNRMKARLLGPWFSFSMIAQEIGWKYGILLFVKMCFDTLISPINYFISKESYFQYLKRKGIESSKILKLVDNVQ
ncbi:nucleotidyltransferase family protein [Polaribacter vadi]|uniref:nucleotidyltransferase family protein n=1 Tax=Polaribacter vadi TaxID=1774273 RepID=UPI0030EE7EF6|tara:strand:+ start:4981 stop:6342 length:1362 start_codon:yes stop_codon:yes gene_type:complete